jgi:uncharacterized protein
MKKILLDTNFIINCVKQKIDFFEEIKLLGFKIIIPENVIREIEKIKNSKQKQYNREAANLALRILEKSEYERIKFKKRNVDKAIKDFVDSENNIIVATLDKELKNKIKGHKMIIRNKKKLEII